MNITFLEIIYLFTVIRLHYHMPNFVSWSFFKCEL